MRFKPISDHSIAVALPFGILGLQFDNAQTQIWEISFLPPNTPLHPPEQPVAVEALTRIEAWLDAPDTVLKLPLAPRPGTHFQQKVWTAIRRIPAGKTITYGELATELHSSPRAVGQACGANPFPLATPCHRVIAATGLGGFAHASDGFLLAAKRWLLANEQ